MTSSAIRALESVYRELDHRIASVLRDSAVACRACGECCTFPDGAPVLYATALERAYLASVPPGARGDLPDGVCPYLDMATRRCTARERRTVGCRTHFCREAVPDEGAREAVRALGERALAGVRKVVEESGLEWDYAPVVERLSAR